MSLPDHRNDRTTGKMLQQFVLVGIRLFSDSLLEKKVQVPSHPIWMDCLEFDVSGVNSCSNVLSVHLQHPYGLSIYVQVRLSRLRLFRSV